MLLDNIFPFAAIEGQNEVKKAIQIAIINNKVGGLLISGEKGSGKTTLVRSSAELLTNKKLINLPLNISEDMLFGSIDFEYALTKGRKKFSRGILGKASGNVLYVDEINLLRQELLIALLEANSSGVNRVERDGISYEEDVDYIVIGTMNPEEGTLPQHILERFGMFVDVKSEKNLQARKEIINKRLQYDSDKVAFRETYKAETDKLVQKLAAAQTLVKTVEVSEAMLQLTAQICTQANCAGHRAELYLIEVAKSIAALNGRSYIMPKDIDEAAIYVLPHRMRSKSEQEMMQENSDNDKDDKNQNDTDESEMPPFEDNDIDENNSSIDDMENDGGKDESENKNENPEEFSQNELAPEEEISSIDKNFKLPKIIVDFGTDRKVRRGSGKRSTTITDLKQGRYVRAELPKNKIEDLAFDATIRAAAPYQKMRRNENCAISIKETDLRQKVREKRIGNIFLFVVDASGSMGARERMKAVKGAIFFMLKEAYEKRDRVGLIAFRRKQAELLLPITRSVDLAQKKLAEMPTGGKTPLADGLALALSTLLNMNKSEKEQEPVLILITDGRANAVDEDENPIESALNIADKIARAKITSVVIDTENDFMKLGIAKELSAKMGAAYYSFNKLGKENLIHIVKNIL